MPELVLYINKIHMSHGCMMCGQVIMPELIMIAAKDTHYAICQSCADKRVPELELLRRTLSRYEGYYHTHESLQELVDELIETGEVYGYSPIELDATLHVCLTRST